MKLKRILLALLLSLTNIMSVLPTTAVAADDAKELTGAAATLPESSLYRTATINPDTWVFTDGLGREALTNADVGDPKENKTLALFYWLWHDHYAPNGAINVSEIMKKYPEAKNDYDHKIWQTSRGLCFWNEPLFGYYKTTDKWVLARHAELLANAGVDTVFFDNTNGTLTWDTGYNAVFKQWQASTEDGVAAPKAAFMLPFAGNEDSKTQLKHLYKMVYSKNKYSDMWFMWDGKPMIMAHKGNLSRRDDTEKSILDFFTFRGGQPLYKTADHVLGKQWGWLATYPQAKYGKKATIDTNPEQIAVGVAQNHNYKLDVITAMNGDYVTGRSYTSEYPDRYEKEGEEASLYGYNFAEQFEYAIEANPQVIFVTGWNEWVALRQPGTWGGKGAAVENALPDQFIDEFSRDIEPTKGPLKDHYYYQFVNFSRKFKGVDPIPTPSAGKTINLEAGQAQWADVAPYYASYINDIDDRRSTGYGSLKFVDKSGRNDIIGSQVSRDNDYLYFNVECREDITPYTDSLWMNLYIDSDKTNAGWESFDYVVGKTAGNEKTLVLEKFTGNGFESEKVADVEYKLDGRYLTVKIPKSAMGISGNDYTVNFLWTDNVHDEGDDNKFSGDILDFYLSGDVAPSARFKFSYISTTANTGNIIPAVATPETTAPETESAAEDEKATEAPATETETEKATEKATEPATEKETEAETETEKATEKETEKATETESATEASTETASATEAATETETETETEPIQTQPKETSVGPMIAVGAAVIAAGGAVAAAVANKKKKEK